MDDIITIAQSTFQRVARMKALYVILAICVLDVAAMSAYKDLSLGMEKELMFDCALALSLIVGLITSMVAAFEVPRELREKTAQFILSKPMGRSAFLWGKFFGIASLAVFNIAIVLVGSLMAYRLSFGETPWEMAQGGALIAAEAVALTGIGILLSVFLSDTMAAIGQFAFFAIGHCLHMLPQAKVLGYVFPNFHHLDIKTELSHLAVRETAGAEIEISNAFIGLGVGYGIAYALFTTGLATVIFSRKDVH